MMNASPMGVSKSAQVHHAPGMANRCMAGTACATKAGLVLNAQSAVVAVAAVEAVHFRMAARPLLMPVTLIQMMHATKDARTIAAQGTGI
jgi:hypothetical protein